MDFFVPKYRRDPNEKVESLYGGIAPGGKTVTRVIKPSADQNHMESTSTFSEGLQRGQGGRAAVLVLGGMETTLAEMEYILEAKQAKPFVPKKTNGEIAAMCRLVMNQRNEEIERQRKNPMPRPQKKRGNPIFLPKGFKMAPTKVPGLNVRARV